MKNILIILPYGDLNPEESRLEQLKKIIKCLLTHIDRHKSNKTLKFFILISEQIYPTKFFNRGLLINSAIKFFKTEFGTPTHIIFHDIDILPNDELFDKYIHTHKSLSLIPLNSPTFKKTYGFKLFTGSAIYMTTPEVFIKANGFPNNFWGWGGEDNALHNRYRKIKVFLKYNKNGDYVNIDKHRVDNKSKLDYLKKNSIRNMQVWELLDDDKINYAKNGINNMPVYDLQSDIKNNIIHLKHSFDAFV